MTLTDEEKRISDGALKFAKANRRAIARRFTDPKIYVPEQHPVSVFMAGSPGAGKTEASIELIQKIGTPVIRIDPDDLRNECPGYTGDGTLSNYDRARRNIDRSLGRKRTVQILYVYQEPMLAWDFVVAREAAEGRRIKPEHFVEQYFAAREVVNRLKREYGGAIAVDLLLKNNDNSNRMYKAGVDQVDHHIPERYTRADVERMLE